MRIRTTIVAVAIAAATAIPIQASAVGRGSCVGQALSTIAPVAGGELGQTISNEARNAEDIFGAKNLGTVVAELARADRSSCPEE